MLLIPVSLYSLLGVYLSLANLFYADTREEKKGKSKTWLAEKEHEKDGSQQMALPHTPFKAFGVLTCLK